ncbi:hypothetical protein Tco_0206285 [Tanacetum coccineum]
MSIPMKMEIMLEPHQTSSWLGELRDSICIKLVSSGKKTMMVLRFNVNQNCSSGNELMAYKKRWNNNDGDGDALIPAKSAFHYHMIDAQTAKTIYKDHDSRNHERSRIKDKDFVTNSDITSEVIYNMVAYLKKPEGSEGFHQIVDFLNASHIRSLVVQEGGEVGDRLEADQAYYGGHLLYTKLSRRYTACVDCKTVRLQAKLGKNERSRIIRVNEALALFQCEEWEDIQARVKVDEEEKSILLHKELKRRNKPPTQAQQRTYMYNYIKHMEGYTLQQLRGYYFDEIKTLFETTMRSVHTFVPIESEIERGDVPLALGSNGRSSKLDHNERREIDILHVVVEKEYPLSKGNSYQMLVQCSWCEQDNEISEKLLR